MNYGKQDGTNNHKFYLQICEQRLNRMWISVAGTIHIYGKMQSFKARSILEGYYIKMLEAKVKTK